jgi:hypothetical protein
MNDKTKKDNIFGHNVEMRRWKDVGRCGICHESLKDRDHSRCLSIAEQRKRGLTCV